MPKNTEKKRTFTPQPYPLYAWGMWVEAVFNDDFDKVIDYEFNIDRLTVVGWMQSGGEVVPMVSSLGYGVVPLYAFSGRPESCPYVPNEDLLPGMLDDEFLLVEISLVEPESEVYEVARNFYKTINKYRNKLTVVDEADNE